MQTEGHMERFDVAIAGGGLVGCATAYYLSDNGAKVVVLEEGDLNLQASGRNAGSLHFQLEYRLVRHGDELAEQFAQVIPLTLTALEYWRVLEHELQSDLEIEMNGGLIVAETRADMESLEKRQAIQERMGLPTALLSTSEVRKIAPYLSDNVIGAGYCEHEGHANPRLVTLAFARAATARGAHFVPGTRVVGIATSGAGWEITTRENRGDRAKEFYAGKIVNAAGAWAGDLAALAHLHLPIYPVPLLMNVLERSGRFIPHLVQHASQRLTVKQVADGNILAGGGWPGRFCRTPSGFDTWQRPEVVVPNSLENVRLAARLIPAIRQLHLIRTWAGTTGVTADQMPLLGEIPEAPGFYVAAGGAAFTHGPTYARLISELVSGETPSLSIDLYSPSRFSHVNEFMAAGSA
jgi:sarcosine oxidase, subunit beta